MRKVIWIVFNWIISRRFVYHISMYAYLQIQNTEKTFFRQLVDFIFFQPKKNICNIPNLFWSFIHLFENCNFFVVWNGKNEVMWHLNDTHFYPSAALSHRATKKRSSKWKETLPWNRTFSSSKFSNTFNVLAWYTSIQAE